MTGLTGIAAGDMVAGLAGGLAAVMTADAVAGDTAVIEGGTGETVGVVAIVTGIGTLWVIGRFTQRHSAVVAADTAALNFGVVDPDHR